MRVRIRGGGTVNYMLKHGPQRVGLSSSVACKRPESLPTEVPAAHRVGILASTVVSVVVSLPLLVWWFGVLGPQGDLLILQYRDKGGCEIVRRAYLRVSTVKVTSCVEDGKHDTEGV